MHAAGFQLEDNMAVTFEDEFYECPSCNGKIGNPIEKPNGWRCISCGESLNIYATDWNGTKNVLKRITASNLEKGDLIVLHGSPFNEFNEVLDVSIDDKSQYRIALKGYGVLKSEGNKEFNCIEGSW